MVRLHELLSAIEVQKIIHEKEIEISGLSYHSGKVQNGHLFVCIKGYKTDGHKYLSQAISNGAVACVVEDVQEDVEIPQIVVKNRSEERRVGKGGRTPCRQQQQSNKSRKS